WSDRARAPGWWGLTGPIVMVGMVGLAATFAPQAAAQTDGSASAAVASLRAQADQIANQYFKAMTRSHDLESELASNKQTVDDLEAKAQRARDMARARALIAYTSPHNDLATMLDSRSMLDAARRAHLINSVNARDSAVYANLRTTAEQLRDGRAALEAS